MSDAPKTTKLTLKAFQNTIAAATANSTRELSDCILHLCSSTGATASIYGNYAMAAPCLSAKWETTHANLVSVLSAVLIDVSRLATCLKLDLDEEVFGRAQTLRRTPTNDPALLLIGTQVYASKLATDYLAHKLTTGQTPTADSVATSIRLPNEPKTALGPTFLADIIALTGAILEVMARLEISLQDVMNFGLQVVQPQQEKKP